jgi:Flp pilus assembly protein TadD
MGQKWAAQAAAMNPNFTTLNTQAAFLSLNGDQEEAEKVSAEALKMATEVEMNAYGYQMLNQGKNEEAVAAFLKNTENHPESANAWDSLGEGYALSGDEKNAVKAFKKALSLNPAPNVKANSEKYLKQFGKM